MSNHAAPFRRKRLGRLDSEFVDQLATSVVGMEANETPRRKGLPLSGATCNMWQHSSRCAWQEHTWLKFWQWKLKLKFLWKYATSSVSRHTLILSLDHCCLVKFFRSMPFCGKPPSPYLYLILWLDFLTFYSLFNHVCFLWSYHGD